MKYFINSMRTWRRVLFALYLRELQSKFNDRFGLSWAFIEPFVFASAFAFVRHLLSGGQDVHTVPVIIFMMIGLIFIQSFLKTVNMCASAIKRSKPLYAFRQVQPISAVLAESFVELTTKFVVILLAVITVFLMKIPVEMHNAITLMYSFILLWLSAISAGLLFAIAIAFIPEVQKLMSMGMRPLFFISGTFFSLQDIPTEYWPYLTWNPILHLVEMARYSVFESYGDAGVNLLYPSMLTLILWTLALSLYHITWKRILVR